VIFAEQVFGATGGLKRIHGKLSSSGHATYHPRRPQERPRPQ
jgi:hypothetical protein